MVGARRPHRKTRNGCLSCKSRRIKCDEVKPSCSTCTRYSSPCIYPTVASTPHVSHPTSDHQGDLLVPKCPPLSTHSPSQSIFAIPNGPPYNIQQLELLHFYTTTTCFTFTTLPARQQLYQYIVPQIAFQHDFLLGGILALSALHLAYLQPHRKETLHRDATLYHDPALASFKTAMTHITPQSCDAVCVFSTFLVAYAWASSDGTGNLFFSDSETSTGSETAEWVRLLRGCRTLIRKCYDWVMAGRSRTFLEVYNGQPMVSELPAEDTAKFAALETLWGPQSTFTPDESASLSEALGNLKEAHAMLLAYTPTSTSLCTISLTIAWSTRCPDICMELIAARRPEALILLAHYCLLLNKVDNVWWLRGISRHLLKSIHATIGEEWEGWIAWPLQELVLTEFRGESREREYGLMIEENRL